MATPILKLAALVLPLTAAGLLPQDEADPQVDPQVDPLAELEAEYFATADHDGDGSLTFREAEASLLVDRVGFGRYDQDQDGLIDRSEFGLRMRELIERTGSFQRPLPKGSKVLPGASEPAPSGASPEAFVGLYDVDVDGRLSLEELSAAAAALGMGKLDPALLVAQLDADESGLIEPAELAATLALLEGLGATEGLPTPPAAATIEELFGGAEPREVYLGSTPRPPVIEGPVRPFRRLDLDDDGLLEVEDLDQLVRSSHTRLRPSAVLAAFDRDGNGHVDRAELEAAFDG